MSKVSVLILAYNEEDRIADCINSVKSFADEIIVIDDFSTDRTAEISERLGAKVITRALDGNFSAQKNFAIDQARFDWIFSIDSDERVTEKLSKHIRSIVDENDQKFAYRVPRLNFFFDQPLKHGGWFPDYVTRLLPKAGTRVDGIVHEKFVHNCEEKNFPRDEYLIHYPYKNWEHYFGKFNTYTTLAAKKMVDQGKSANVIDIIFRPIWAWFRMYILRFGFLDGKIGFFLATFHFFYTMVKYVKLYYLRK